MSNFLENTNVVLPIMTAMHLLWLGVIWWTGTAHQKHKLPILIGYSLTMTIAVWMIPPAFWSHTEIIIERLSGDELLAPLSLALVALIAGGVYSRYQRVWPFDEEYSYQAAQIGAVKGMRAFFEEYPQNKWLGQQHPPLIPLMGGAFMRIFGVRLFAFRLVSVFFAIGTVLVTYGMGRAFFDPRTGWVAGLLLLSFPLFTRMSSIAIPEMPVAFFTSLVLFWSLTLRTNPGYWLAAGMGIVAGLGLVSKYTAGMLFIVMFFQLLVEGNLRTMWPYFALTLLVALGVLGLWLVYAFLSGILEKQVQLFKTYIGTGSFESPDGYRHSVRSNIRSAAQPAIGLKQRWGLLGSSRIRYRLEAFLTRLPSSIGVYHLVSMLAGFWLLFENGGFAARFIAWWVFPISAILFAILPDHRYFLQIFPAIALTIAVGFSHTVAIGPVLLLTFALWIGNLYLFVDWFREKHLFLLHLNNRKKRKIAIK